MTAATVRTTTRTLGRVEAALLLRSSTLWTGALVTVGLCTTWLRGADQTWETVWKNTGLASLELAGFLILLGHLAASRDYRHGAREAASTLPVRPAQRSVALLSVVAVGGLLGALCLALELLTLSPDRPTGTFEPWSVLLPVVTPMIGAALGVAVGCWLPSTAAGPLTLFTAAAAIAVLPVIGNRAGSVPWRLFPVEVQTGPAPGWHLLYLLSLLTALVCAALLRHSRRRLTLTAVLCLAIALGVVAVHEQGAAL